jgi:hypothetical protein
MLSMLVLFVLIFIVFQISIATGTDARVTRNENVLEGMDLAIDSYLLQVADDLKADGESDAAAAQSQDPSAGGDAAAAGALAGATGGEGGAQAPADSREDAWAKIARTEMNGVQLRILVQDEDSKYNLLALLAADEIEAEKAVDRLARIIDYFRGGTENDVDTSTARRLAESVRDYLVRRRDQALPKPVLLTDDEDDEERGVPLTLRELVAIDAFQEEGLAEDLFRDFRDPRGKAAHSLGSFLTVWSGVTTAKSSAAASGAAASPPAGNGSSSDTGGESDASVAPDAAAGLSGADGSGADSSEASGTSVNVNTAPEAVLKALMEDGNAPFRFWDEVIRYRNEKDESIDQGDEDANAEPSVDEFGDLLEVKKFFHAVEDLAQVDGWNDLDAIVQGELKNLLSTRSHVFSIFVTARKMTGVEGDSGAVLEKDELQRQEEAGQGLTRTVRCVVWRRTQDDGSVEIVPLQRWEVLDYVPIEVLDTQEREERER